MSCPICHKRYSWEPVESSDASVCPGHPGMVLDIWEAFNTRAMIWDGDDDLRFWISPEIGRIIAAEIRAVNDAWKEYFHRMDDLDFKTGVTE